MSDYAPLLAALIALLAGLAIGKAWERYKLRGGTWIDRRRARQSPHYILGLNFLVSNQVDLAIEELSHAASLDADALEVHMILGNLYREKGQVGKAITVHQSLLQRARLSRIEHAYVLLCPGARLQARRLRRSRPRGLPRGAAARSEERVRADEFAEAARRTAPVDRGLRHPPASHPAVGAGTAAAEPGDPGLSRERDRPRGDAPPGSSGSGATVPVGAGSRRQGHPRLSEPGRRAARRGKGQEAATTWETLVEIAPDRAYLAFDRLQAYAVQNGTPDRFTKLCERLIDANPQDWRARLALARHLITDRHFQAALDLLFSALVQNPHALGIHQEIWRALGWLGHPQPLVDRYSDLTQHAVFYLDPHVCMRCRYRSTELLWQCPHCHDWNTFVEERIAPAQDTTEVEV